MKKGKDKKQKQEAVVPTLTTDEVRDMVNEIIGRGQLIPFRYEKIVGVYQLRAEVMAMANQYLRKYYIMVEAVEFLKTLEVKEEIHVTVTHLDGDRPNSQD